MKRIISRHKAFLKAFAGCASITVAAKATGIDRSQHYDWLKNKPGYPEEFADAMSEAAELMQDEAVRRAHAGVFEPNIWQGEFVYPTRKRTNPETGEEEIVRGKKPLGTLKYSDTLLQFLLKGLKPERYRDRVSAEVSGPAGGPISLEQKRLVVLTDDELAQLIAVATKLTAPSPNGSGAITPPA